MAPLNLAGRVVSLPGHTSGSVAVLLDDGRAFVGDMLAGGYLGGALHPTQPSEHYFHGSSARNNLSLAVLLKLGARSFFIGHGGPLAREGVERITQALSAQSKQDVLIHPKPPVSSQPEGK